MNEEFKELPDELKDKYSMDELHRLKVDRTHLRTAIKHVLIEYSGRERHAIRWSELEDLSDCIACYVIGSGELGYLKGR